MIRLQNTGTFIFLTDLHSLLGLCTVTKQQPHLRNPQGKELRVANSQLGTEALGPAALEELNPTNEHVSLEADPAPAKPWDETLTLADSFIAAWERP